ncbi:P-II family nitrogen regulator [Geofilum sp. OHC36d9]|uniref:P-II family nitrogen regulator n=1 Tax=Geofilum sp. OHC36d9 TaxID=3458413 RepID=UPI004034F514
MKLILAVIRIAKMQETKAALSEAGLPSFTAMAVLGRGQGNGDLEKAVDVSPQLHELIPETPRFKSKRLISLVVTDDKKEIAVETIIKANQTNKSGDGKIFVTDTIDSFGVRTGASGDTTLD